MLDFDLINRNVDSVRASLKNKQGVGLPWAYQLTNIFTDDMLGKINAEFDLTTEWGNTALQLTADRREIPWKSDSVVEEVRMVLEEVSNSVSQVFERPVKLRTSTFWQDGETYTILPHTDAIHTNYKKIDVSMQIYVGESAITSGTEFYVDNRIFYKCPWVPNTGYALSTSDTSFHGMMSPGSRRRSIFAIYQDCQSALDYSNN